MSSLKYIMHHTDLNKDCSVFNQLLKSFVVFSKIKYNYNSHKKLRNFKTPVSSLLNYQYPDNVHCSIKHQCDLMLRNFVSNYNSLSLFVEDNATHFISKTQDTINHIFHNLLARCLQDRNMDCLVTNCYGHLQSLTALVA